MELSPHAEWILLVDTYHTGFKMVPTEAYDGDGNLYHNFPSSSFLNARYEQGWDPWNHMANFRDDTYQYRKHGPDLMDFVGREP